MFAVSARAVAVASAAVLATTGPVASAVPAAAEPEPAPVACQVHRSEASAAAGSAGWSVTCSARRNVWVGIDYYSDQPHTVQATRWVDPGESWAGHRGLPVDPPLRQVCLTVLESGRWVIGHVCDTR